ncbi:MAG: tetratricopeptide repeat protein [Thermoanaerobaculia bacterium]
MEYRTPHVLAAVFAAVVSVGGYAQAPQPARIAQLETEITTGTASRAEQLELATLYVDVGRFYEASQIAERILATSPDDAEATRVLGRAREGLDEIQREKVIAAEARAQAPGATAEDRLALADAYFGAGRHLSAAAIYADLPERLRTREVRLRHARALSWGGRMWDAERIYAQLLREETSPELELEYGRMLSWMGASSAARERLIAIYERERTDEAVVALANSLAWSGRRDEAVEILREHIRRTEDSPEAEELLASLTESPDLRLERVARLIEVEPYNLALQMERARLLAEAGRYSQTLSALEDIEEVAQGEDIEGFDELRREAEEGRARELAALETRRAQLPATASAETATEILDLAKAYVGVGGHDEAIELYERYLLLRPEDDDARIAYARVLTWDQRYDEAQAQYEILLDAYPDRADLRLEYAKALSWDAEFRPAVDAFRTLTDLSDNPRAYLYDEVPAEAHFHLGQIYRWFGWTDHAIEQQNAALDLDSMYAPARRELDMVRGLRPSTQADLRYTSYENSNDFQANLIDLRGEHWNSRRTAVEGWVGRHNFEHLGESIDANVLAVGGRYRFEDRLTGYARIGMTDYESDIGTQPFWTIGAEHLPSLQSRVAAEYARYDLVYDVFTLRSLERPADPGDAIYIDDLRGHWDYDTGGRWLYLADASYGFISDDNERTALHGLLTFRAWSDPFIGLKADYRYLAYDFRSNSYWSPDDYNSLAGVVQVGDNWRERLYWQVEAKYGMSWEDDRDRDIRSIGGRITVPINDYLDFTARYVEGESGEFDQILPGDELVTYSQRTWYVGVRVKQLFQRDERARRDTYYWDERPLEGSPVLPPLGERR